MNERIKELAIEAGYDWAWDTQIDFGHKEMEKFAELIVKECAAIVWNDKDSQRMLKHFGVEE